MSEVVEAVEVDTPHGPARLRLAVPASPRALLLLGHGAGGGVEAPDLLTAAEVAAGLGAGVVRVEQPYRVEGRRAPAPAAQLDAAWAAVVAEVGRRWPGVAHVHGGRSSGARVACRGALGAVRPVGVLALAFPLLAPARRDGTRPDRGPELDAVTDAGIAVLAVSGERDRFGVPPPITGREVVVIPGDHSLRPRGRLREAVEPWLDGLVAGIGDR